MSDVEKEIADEQEQEILSCEITDADKDMEENCEGTPVDGNVEENLAEPAKEENGETEGNQENAENMEEEIDKLKSEHYSQTKPDEFCSENFKIELGGLPKYYPLSQLKKLLNNTLQLDAHRVKPGGLGRNVAYLNFKDEEARDKALTVLNDYKWQGSSFTAQKADPNKDPLLLSKIDFLKVPKKEHELLPLNERIQKAVTPFHDLSYEDQIKEKEKVVKQVMRKFGNELAQLNPELKDFVHWHKIRRKGQICELDDFVHSPVKTGYRNKCEFTIGTNKESTTPVVGFRVASYKEGTVEVGPVDHLLHINDKMKMIVKLMNQYLSTSKYDAYDPFSHLGVWRQLTVRTSQKDDVMLIVVIHPQEMDETEINTMKEDITSFFTVGDGTEAGITSIFFQQLAQKESGIEVAYEHVYGKTYIEETILGKTFKASPDAFLQINTPGCELLYEKIAEIADVDQTSVVLDVCCGVGSIGLSIAECAYKMMGVELTQTAVENARSNAEMNGIANATFYNGRAEDYIDNMIERSQRANVIAIVDPPRAGLNGSVMNALRKCDCLDKLVYVSCDPQAALANFQALGRPRSKTYKGTYFVPVRAIPVDLFPDTPHFELIILFERYDDCKWDRIMQGNPRPKDQEYFDRVPALTYDPEKDNKEREEKRKRRDRAPRRDRDRDRRRRDNWRRERGDRGGRDRGDRGGRDRDWGDDRGGRWGGGGGGRGRDRDRDGDRGNNWGGARDNNWGGGRDNNWGGGRDDRRDTGRKYGEGFQEGFQAALEALQSQQANFNPGGGGGFNMPPQNQQGGFGGVPPLMQGNMGGGFNNMNQQQQQQPPPLNGNQGGGGGGGGGSWGYEGYDSASNTPAAPPPAPAPAPAPYNNTNQDYNSSQPVTYPTSVTNPLQNQQGGGYGGYQSSGGQWGAANQPPPNSYANQQSGGSYANQQSGGSYASQQPGGSYATQQPGGSYAAQQPASSYASQQSGSSYNNQLGSWGPSYPSYEEPMAKKWKADTMTQQSTPYDYSGYQ